MCRIALLLLLGTAAFAQTDVPPAVTPLAEKPPAEVDQALRARVNEFYTMMKNKDYRKAEGWIADDTKDYYYAGPKPDIRSFELLSVEFSDLAHAKALVRCTMPLVVAGFPPGEITVKVPTLWKIEDGDWRLYEDPVKIANPSGLQEKIQDAVTKAAEGPPQMPKDMPTDPGFALNKVHPDKAELQLAPDTTETVTISNSSPGPVSLELGAPLKGVEAKLDRSELPKGETAVLTLTAGKEPAGGFYYLRIMPTQEIIRIQVHVK